MKVYLQNLKRNKEIISIPKNKTINLEGFKNRKESTTTSSSGRHLGNHHTLLVPDRTIYDNNNKGFVETTRNTHHQIITISLLNEASVLRWLLYIMILLPKDIKNQKSSYSNHKYI